MGTRNAILPGLTGSLFPPEASDEEVADLVLGWVEARRRDWQGVEQCAAAARREFDAVLMARRYADIYVRPRQLIRTATPPPWDGEESGLPALFARLREDRTNRVSVLRHLALALAREGQAKAACRALGRAFRRAPLLALRPDRWLDPLVVGAALGWAAGRRRGR